MTQPADRAPDGEETLTLTVSPAFTALVAKLRAFEELVQRGRLAKAAVVAADVRAIVASFDPLACFPALFASHYRTLAGVSDELNSLSNDSGQPSWYALEQLYRVDLAAFLDDDV